MVVGILLAIVLLVPIVWSVRGVARDLRRLHRTGRNLVERPSDADGVSAAGVVAIGNNITH